MTRTSCTVVIFSPALESLYGELDRVSGHWRRYSRQSISAVARGAGLRVLVVGYIDALSIVPYWLRGRLLRRPSIGENLAKTYDRYYLPVARMVHRGVRPPVGKGILCVAALP